MPPILGTWNVWWWDESLPRFRSTTSITKTAAKITWNGRSLFGCSCFCADKKSWVKKGKQNWAYPKKRKMTVCFFKAGGGYISSFGTNWLKLTWTSKSHFVWHGVFTSLLISVERRWSQSCFRNSTFPLTCGLTGTIEHLQKLETNKVHPNYGPYIEDQLIFIYIYIFLKGVTRFWMDIWGGHIFLVATSIVFLYGFFHLDCLITRNPWILMKPIYWWEGGWTKLHHKLIISLDEIILNLDKSMSKIHVFIYIYTIYN